MVQQVLWYHVFTCYFYQSYDTAGSMIPCIHMLFLPILWYSRFYDTMYSHAISTNFPNLVFLLPKILKLFGFERTWWRLFQKCVVYTKFYTYMRLSVLLPDSLPHWEGIPFPPIGDVLGSFEGWALEIITSTQHNLYEASLKISLFLESSDFGAIVKKHQNQNIKINI